jgi:S-DNA-T family DNA segregation ATPase FtsK/SpoIIIE
VSQASSKERSNNVLSDRVGHALSEGAMWLLLFLALYLLLALLSYSPQDPSWSYVGTRNVVENLGGAAGAWFADVLLYLFGFLAYLFPILIARSGVLVFHRAKQGPVREPNLLAILLSWSGFLLTLSSGAGLATIYFQSFGLPLPAGPGGVLGIALSDVSVAIINKPGTTLLLLALFLGGSTLAGLSWFRVMDQLGQFTLASFKWLSERASWLREQQAGAVVRRQRSEVLKQERVKERAKQPLRIEPVIEAVEPSPREERERQAPLFEADPNSELPPVALLDPPKKSGVSYSQEALQAMSRQVELKLRDFGVEANVIAVYPGPVVTLFEIELAAGLKVSKIVGLSKDLARSLSAHSVRVQEAIPGKPYVGLEVSNESREMVYLSEVLKSAVYDDASSPLTLALGMDIAGQPVVADLGKMPHVLIAGTTGSGKSVAINAMILSLLYKAKPSEVRLIMVDPKMLELSVYEGIPHLLTPVVTDMDEAGNALRWCVGEMERRYKLMSTLGVRSIASYNQQVKAAIAKGEPIKDPLFQPASEAIIEAMKHPTLEPMPYIVVVIDELADLMMVARKKVETLIARLAQKARACGIHLVLATQRPSVDVLTGLIKANIPTRIAFQVSARVDSRTVLDQMGAEHLLGHGDMLYLASGKGQPQRLHGAFVDDDEVHRVVEHLKQSGPPDYISAVLDEPQDRLPGIDEDDQAGGDVESSDKLYDEAVFFVTKSRRASISSVQRQLRVGYNRAARLVEEMERAGVVGPAEHNGARTVLAPPPLEG